MPPWDTNMRSRIQTGRGLAASLALARSEACRATPRPWLASGELSGSLTNSSNSSYLNVPDGNYQRRGDLMDCAPFLLEIMNQ